MKRAFKIAIVSLVIIALIVLAILYINTHNIAVLNPKGMIGVKERRLLIDTSLLMLIVVIPAILLTLIFAWKYRATNEKATFRPEWGHSNLAEVLWWGIPSVIIVFLAIMTYESSHALNPFKPIVNGKKPVKIQAVALEWKWLFIYPEEGIAALNFVQFPIDRPLNFEITADAPMNSFWIPQIGGQIYAMPAMRTKLHLIANEVGDFRGASSNFSGKGFAGMHFVARASTEEDYERWVESVRSSARPLTFKEYNHELVPQSSYVPAEMYSLAQPDLFDSIIMKYTGP